jgi:hypothetical protein
MKKLLAVAVLLLAPLLASATCTVTKGSTPVGYSRNSCTATTESAPSLATDGVNIIGDGCAMVFISFGGAATAGANIAAYLYNQATATWYPWVGGNLTITTATAQSFIVQPLPAQGRLDFRPNGSGAVTSVIDIVPARCTRSP